jgi:hypothetical protein
MIPLDRVQIHNSGDAYPIPQPTTGVAITRSRLSSGIIIAPGSYRVVKEQSASDRVEPPSYSDICRHGCEKIPVGNVSDSRQANGVGATPDVEPEGLRLKVAGYLPGDVDEP